MRPPDFVNINGKERKFITRFWYYLSEEPSCHHHELVHSPTVNAEPFTSHRDKETLHEEQRRLFAPKTVWKMISLEHIPSLLNSQEQLTNSVSDLHWFQCESGSSFLPQWGSGSRDPNKCGFGFKSWSHFAVTKNWILTWKTYFM
jgi:hypothetical protein